jgi:hypothetical protein
MQRVAAWNGQALGECVGNLCFTIKTEFLRHILLSFFLRGSRPSLMSRGDALALQEDDVNAVPKVGIEHYDSGSDGTAHHVNDKRTRVYEV